MKLPYKFYEPEVREGYYIPSEMKRCWAATLRVLHEIDVICKKYNIQYYADYGTMLGAVRHKGFIPWDDDIDISMKRADYMRFLQVAKSELPDRYEVLSFYSRSDQTNYVTRVVNSGYISYEQEFLLANNDYPYVAGIDIFPLDYVSSNSEDNELQVNLIKYAQEIIKNLDGETVDIEKTGSIAGNIRHLCELCGVSVNTSMPLRQQIYIIIDRLMAMFTEDESDRLANMFFWVTAGNHAYDKGMFDNTIMLPFECINIPLPVGYDKILEMNYGQNYMIPIRSWDTHNYPQYKDQEAAYYDSRGDYFYKRYEFRPDDIARERDAASKGKSNEIVFISFSSDYWKMMEPEWKLETAKSESEVYVMPIPYYSRGNLRSDNTVNNSLDEYPEYLNIVDYRQYNLEERHPAKIYIQFPYDEYDSGVDIDSVFYASRLKSLTTELIYIPYFNVDDFGTENIRSVMMSDFYIRVPAVVMSDKIILRSEVIRQRYIDSLVSFCGEEYREHWEESVIVRKINCIDISSHDGDTKKTLIYHTNVGNIIYYRQRYFEKIKRTLAAFAEKSSNMDVIWQDSEELRDILEVEYPDLWDEYIICVNDFINSQIGEYITNDCNIVPDKADAYFGDRDTLMYEMYKQSKPVMIQNIEL